MSENAPRVWVGRFVLMLAGVAAGMTGNDVQGQVQIDCVVLIDGSGSVDPCLFEFEKEAIATLICGGDCTSCAPAYLPHDGSIAIAVVQFAGDAPDDAVLEVELAPLDTFGTPTPQAVCESVESITKYLEGGGTPLMAGLQKAREVFEESTTGATQRLLIIVTDVDAINPGDMIMRPTAEAMRTLCGGPVRIVGFRFRAVGRVSRPDSSREPLMAAQEQHPPSIGLGLTIRICRRSHELGFRAAPSSSRS